MHPDALKLVAEVLIEASQNVQLIVTTHSDALIDALSAQPDVVLVCERDFDNSTQFRRLSAKELDGWLAHYSLGDCGGRARSAEAVGRQWLKFAFTSRDTIH